MTEITFVDKIITILASVERFLWIVDKLACDPFPARHKYRKLHRVLSGHQAAFNKTAEWNLHLFLPPCHHGEALWRPLFTKRLEMVLFNQVEPSVCVWGHACAFITERVCVMYLTYGWHTSSADSLCDARTEMSLVCEHMMIELRGCGWSFGLLRWMKSEVCFKVKCETSAV